MAAHGNYDKPDWQCLAWRQIVGDTAFVVSPRGVPRPDSDPGDTRFEYRDGPTLVREIDAALGALRRRFGPWVDDGPMVYAGFSLGAIHGIGVASGAPGRFPRAVLVEGGHDGWTERAARKFAGGGGLRVLFACGQTSCVQAARAAAARLDRAQVATKVVLGDREGHSYVGKVADRVREAWPWLVEGDPRWQAP